MAESSSICNESLAFDPVTCRRLMESMRRIRVVEETIAERYGEQKMRCPTHLCTGQEAVGAACGLAMRPDDLAVSTHRAHGHYLGKGGSLNRMIAEIYGKATGCSGGKGGSMHLVDLSVGFVGSTPIVGGTIPIGVGLALSIELRETDQISCVYLGDGATEEGVFYESVNFAVLRKLPVLFVCENNLYSVYSPLEVRQPAGRQIYRLAAALGAHGVWVDGNDALAVHAAAVELVARLRRREGPCLMECATYRWREHCGPLIDNKLGYRTEQEFLQWKEKDPIPRLEARLLKAGVFSREDLRNMDARIRTEVETAFRFAEESPFPSESAMYSDLADVPETRDVVQEKERM